MGGLGGGDRVGMEHIGIGGWKGGLGQVVQNLRD